MTFGGYVIYIFNLGVAMGAVLAFIAIAYSGMRILNAGGDPSSVEDSRKRIINALLGLAVLLGSYLLLTTINPDLVNVKNISLGGVSINIPIFSSEPTQSSKEEMTFKEIPMGTLTESILAGNSSTRNKLECYEYDDETGDPIDKNGDKKITEKDIILDRDIFYCIKDLDKALRKKAETKLPKLIKELNALMQSCSCERTFTNYQPSHRIYQTGGECNCDACDSYCNGPCGHPHTGCPGAPGNSQSGDSALEQYFYDPCPNRKQIDCKREEIKQMMDGTKPEEVCYSQGWISDDTPQSPQLLTFSDGIKRMTAFKDYFNNQVNTLKQLEKDTKTPFGQRLTLAEFYTLQNTAKENVIKREGFGDYNIYRYCDEYNCTRTETVDNETKCVEYELNDGKRICKKSGSTESFMYDGDPATFYFNAGYYEQQKAEMETAKAKGEKDTCSVYEKDVNGVIPIGETVDGTETYGLEVAARIGYLIDNIQGVYTTALAISEIPQSCDSGNCSHAQSNCCYSPQCGCNGDCCCPGVYGTSCYKGVPSASKYADFRSYSSGSPLTQSYGGCSTFCGGSSGVRERQPEDQYFTCSYGSFCGLVRKIYQTKEIDSSCYDQTDDTEEKATRQYNMNIVGYLQKWMEREKRLYEVTEIKSLKEIDDLDKDTANEVINNVCRPYFINPDEETLECDSSLSIINKYEKRFYLAEKLSYSRQKMNACITGYSAPYKQNLDKTYVFNCLEGIDHQTVGNLVITPEFPYPSTKASKYQNCYPYNSSGLTKEEKEKCFLNIYRVGDNADPGCQMFVQEYMDNYYCCK